MTHRRLPCLIIVLAFLLPGLTPSAYSEDTQINTVDEFTNLPVRYIRLESEFPYSQRNVMQVLDIREGDPFTLSAIRSSLRHLNQLHRFRQIRVTVEPFLDGCMVIFHLEPEWILRNLEFKDKRTGFLLAYGFNSRLSKRDILRECKIQENEVFTDLHLEQTLVSLKALYRDYGYSQCRIKTTIERFPEKRELDVILKFIKGPPTRIHQVEFIGNETISAQKLIQKIKSKPGRRYNNNSTRNDVEKIKDYYLKQGYLEISVSEPQIRIDHSKNVVNITYRVREGPRSKIKISGNKHWWNLNWWMYLVERKPQTIYKVLGVDEGKSLDHDQIEDGSEHITNLYRDHGYARAQTVLESTPLEGGGTSYRFQITDNDVFQIAHIDVRGNETFDAVQILNEDLVLSQPGKRYRYQDLLNDIQRIVNYYIEHGFNDVEVEYEDTLLPDDRTASIVFIISEGKQSWIDSITFINNSVLDTDTLLKLMGCRPDSPFNEKNIHDGINRVTTEYRKLGYTETDLEVICDEDKRSGRLKLTVIIDEGDPYFFGKIILRGFHKTNPKVIDRYLPRLENQPYNYESLFKAQNSLSRTGLFSSVRADTRLLEKGENRRAVIITVTESPSLILEGGPGYNTDVGFNGYLSFYTTSLYGTNRYLGASIFVSERADKSQIIYREPEFANFPLQMELRLLRNLTDEDGYRLLRIGGQAIWSYRYNPQLRVLLGYRYSDDKPKDIEPGTLIPEEYRNSIRIGSLAPSFLYDSRDDPRDPGRGSLLSLKVEFARTAYNSEVDFTKTTVETTHFLPLPENRTLGISLRLGWAGDLPFQERFKLGGIKSIRGWGYEEIRGPKLKDQLVPVGTNINGMGGNISLLANIELRSPLAWGLHGVLFFDAGNVYESKEDISTSDLKGTVGIGLRFMTPVGPVGVDYGYNIMRKSDDPTDRWSFIIGHSF